ncbi:membrane protein insertion efficiency factor YidD [Marinicauda salina]|jgi:putative membrane protein insertion efficiency factor|uniref:Putative membrane protein insertion efficiency factor n=1 Tax=Marinicauda salina TaxID=2135793 RepID=A0A2U2BQP4_9PROT|nr:membrane protein insertion efficiency factor YidD [Marinicauda salina]PWE16332.1 membrane protein insertion efficiency factor YidD [Marinicauda salina]
MKPARWILRLPARIGLAALAAYRVILSPVLYAFGVRCRHEPSCSHYASDAVRAQGLWRGGWLALGRVLRCRPGGTHGFDPAPMERSDAPWWRVWGFRDGPERAGAGALKIERPAETGRE